MNFTTVLLEDEITIEIPVGIDNCVESLERFQPNFIKEKIDTEYTVFLQHFPCFFQNHSAILKNFSYFWAK